MALHAAERFSEALACYAKLRAQGKDVMPWAYYQADAALSLYQPDLALTHLRDAFHADPLYAPARIRLAEALLETAPDQARPHVDALLAAHPQSARVHYLACRALTAPVHCRRAIEIEPRFGQAHYELALLLRRAGQNQDAAPHFARFREYGKIQVTLDDPLLARVLALKQSAADHLLAARRHEEAGEFSLALARYQQALAAKPDLVQAHVNLVAIYGRLSRWDQAAASYQAAVALDPGIPETYYNYGLALAAQEKLPLAEQQFRLALERNPHYADAWNNLAHIQLTRGDKSAAEAGFRAAVASRPGHPEAHFNLARLLAKTQPAQASSHFVKALTLPTERTAAYGYYYAMHLRETGDLPGALAQLEQARALAERYEKTDLARYLVNLARQWQSAVH